MKTTLDKLSKMRGSISDAELSYAVQMLPSKKNKGGASMLKNPGKADLDKDGKLSGYEKKRGMAIEANMKAARGKAVNRREYIRKKQNPHSEYDKKGKLKYTAAKMGKSIRGYGAARTSGMGLQDEAMKPEKVMMANKGKEAKGGVKDAASKSISPQKKARLETNFGRNVNPKRADRLRAKREKFIKDIKSYGKKAIKGIMPGAIAASGIKGVKNLIPKKMGGGMMNKPMGYSKGASIMARGCKLGRKKATKLS